MNSVNGLFFSANPDLIRGVERAEAAVGRAYAEAVATWDHSTVVVPFAGGAALFAGVDSPMTHVLGAGVDGPVEPADLDELERFFEERGSATVIDLCPHAHPSMLDLISQRPYRIAEFNHVLAREIAAGERFASHPEVEVKRVEAADSERWANAVLQGFLGEIDFPPEAVRMVEALFRIRSGVAVWGLRAGREIGTAGMATPGEVASFFADSTVPAFRNLGCHVALIQGRLEMAEQSGCRLAMASVLPGSASHRNYERCGFRVLYTRTIVKRPLRE